MYSELSRVVDKLLHRLVDVVGGGKTRDGL